jgi:small subunit ribosomal protein S6
MRTYESIFIVHPEVVGDDQTAIIDKYKTILTNQGAEILKLENWGTRTLAYQVKKTVQGLLCSGHL